MFIDLFAFLSSMSRFPDASEGEKIKLNAYVGEFCFVIFVFFYAALNGYLDTFWIQAYAIKCVKKANFWCTWRSRNVLSTCKPNLVERLNFKTKVIDDIFK